MKFYYPAYTYICERQTTKHFKTERKQHGRSTRSPFSHSSDIPRVLCRSFTLHFPNQSLEKSNAHARTRPPTLTTSGRRRFQEFFREIGARSGKISRSTLPRVETEFFPCSRKRKLVLLVPRTGSAEQLQFYKSHDFLACSVYSTRSIGCRAVI